MRARIKFMLTLSCILIAMLLSACGLRGPLYLPNTQTLHSLSHLS
ncbi:MAG: lipoprotein [Legionellaceae bacterium]|nr:lipoprotein [Legionellaceae bacterium]MBP9774962.1 lipoprotein [Legionellaceae bacterium]